MSAAGTFTVPRHVMARQVGDECVILDLAKGTYYGLGHPGARVWHWLTEGATVDTMCARLAEEFDVTADQARADILELVDSLRERGLVE
jgi:hypothetical protein